MATKTLTKEDILKTLRQSQPQLRNLGVRNIGLFGSFARNEASGKSDIDLLIEFEPNMKTYDHFINACFLLDELFDSKVELVTKDAISQYIKPYIMKDLEYVIFSN